MKFPKGRILSFKYALAGIISALIQEPNLKFHFLTGLVVVWAGWYFRITRIEWMMITFAIGLVISVELTNTAIEAVVNHFTDTYHPGAKLAKDISAGAVLVVAITAAVIGYLVFAPYLL